VIIAACEPAAKPGVPPEHHGHPIVRFELQPRIEPVGVEYETLLHPAMERPSWTEIDRERVGPVDRPRSVEDGPVEGMGWIVRRKSDDASIEPE
jgi:hypothetical protein